ncbi:MAG: GIY-YIG nuclease family protein [Lachnospiraceae bacterium]|nr:GIY-YIG nuclease family protein [Lachnospiraceae bacterium]
MKAYTYILRCKDNSLYTGWTTDLERRVEEHNSGTKGAKCTKARRPCTLVYYETFEDDDTLTAKQKAMKREWDIKHNLTKKEKEELISREKNDK